MLDHVFVCASRRGSRVAPAPLDSAQKVQAALQARQHREKQMALERRALTGATASTSGHHLTHPSIPSIFHIQFFSPSFTSTRTYHFSQPAFLTIFHIQLSSPSFTSKFPHHLSHQSFLTIFHIQVSSPSFTSKFPRHLSHPRIPHHLSVASFLIMAL